MANAKIQDMTPDEFLVWNLSQERRYELVDGVPYPLRAMSGASNVHDQIAVNIIASLHQSLRGSGCRPTTPDTAVRTSIKRVRRPDVTIECAPPEAKSYEARNPVCVFEILSPTTRKTDSLDKLAEYLRHPTLKMIVFIDPDVVEVLLHMRDANGEWQNTRLDRITERFTVPGTPAVLELADIYDGVPLPPSVS
jgi:Uma2 family endonuclease